MMLLLLVALLPAIALGQEATRAQVEAQLETYYRPCFVDAICPPGSNITDNDVQQQVASYAMLAAAGQFQLPANCSAPCSAGQARCARLCYYAIFRQIMLAGLGYSRKRAAAAAAEMAARNPAQEYACKTYGVGCSGKREVAKIQARRNAAQAYACRNYGVGC